MTLTCLAVDDEPLALELVCTFIKQTPFLQLAGRYTSALEALNHLHQHPVDLIFLDIQMPDLSGTDLARVLDKGQPGQGPRIIFTTAFNQYALEGYRLDALDYLLKPFNYVEFLRAANKALAYAELRQKPVEPNPALVEAEEENIFLKVEYQLVRVALKDILYIEGLKDYVKVHLQSATKPILSLTSLKALEEKLPAKKFMRIHRSFIVALDKIQSVTRQSVQIKEVNIPVSDQFKEQFNKFLSRWV
ncbi:LytR/AlgR family response regulator transcription factor [Adhaeribacter rhizoryzae]|uniref:Response regulator transcription factor n=1 Tax=Adhaeribacter rhizoryzae TaxID=2607907 RepID=A0A5M6DJX1_9BACT|nr:LytTR family DNA-binding domain-containing protein [Adhaeribacter rhizoryzae]KAA5546562.1 response regulator transcription factor [Adhaeribacter rhizoryzae]